MKLDYDKISQRFMKKMAMMGKMGYGDEQLVIIGMSDILDAISDVHPELLHQVFSVRTAIEQAIDARDEAEEKANA